MSKIDQDDDKIRWAQHFVDLYEKYLDQLKPKEEPTLHGFVAFMDSELAALD